MCSLQTVQMKGCVVGFVALAFLCVVVRVSLFARSVGLSRRFFLPKRCLQLCVVCVREHPFFFLIIFFCELFCGLWVGASDFVD